MYLNLADADYLYGCAVSGLKFAMEGLKLDEKVLVLNDMAW